MGIKIEDGLLYIPKGCSGRLILFNEDNYDLKEGTDISVLSKVGGYVPKEDFNHVLAILEDEEGIKAYADTSFLYDCVMEKILRWEFDGCKKVKNKCSDSCDDFTMYTYILMSAFEDALRYDHISDAISILKQLKELCKDCFTNKVGSGKSNTDCGCNGV